MIFLPAKSFDANGFALFNALADAASRPGDCDIHPLDPPLRVQLQATAPETMP